MEQPTRRLPLKATFQRTYAQKDDVFATIPCVAELDGFCKSKTRWSGIAAALPYRLHKLDVLTDWQYRTFGIQINRRYGTREPNGRPQYIAAVVSYWL
jgi:hypothetical protein